MAVIDAILLAVYGLIALLLMVFAGHRILLALRHRKVRHETPQEPTWDVPLPTVTVRSTMTPAAVSKGKASVRRTQPFSRSSRYSFMGCTRRHPTNGGPSSGACRSKKRRPLNRSVADQCPLRRLVETRSVGVSTWMPSFSS